MAGKFEIFTDRDSQFRFRLTSDDGNVLAVSGGYDQKAQAVAAITAVRENAAMGHIVDLTDLPTLYPAESEKIGRSSQLVTGRARMEAALGRPARSARTNTLRLVQGI
ncbi:DUF1508 domain-containing protein [Paenarthrobacter sp. DKR-5]|uniref:YegP family protein n=1 Tax=Paenarthrobacter sp. DKR-5 TaxID=2835535 RepID=UPI001BDD1224|nr:DUF1508 domain-containing protein [Paenarthrobacter sp. DKR-5]MBT1001745.1 DUF1508 domain-containing protein [Paenarthrobacter sp. DKR-5]